MQCLEAAFDRARPQRHPGAQWLGDALKVSGTEVLELEEIAEKPARRFGNDHRIWLGNPLQPRCKVWRLADDAAFMRLARSDQIADNDQPSSDANPGLQRNRRLERNHRRDQLQSSTHCPLGVVLMGLGVAKVDKCAIAQILRHETAKTTHSFRDALLVVRNDFARGSSGSIRAESAVEPTKSENITVTWRRSARSSGAALVAAGAVFSSLEGPRSLASLRRAAMASSSFTR